MILKIIQITDIHLLANKADTIYGINIYLSLQKIIEAIRFIEDIDCIILTGDIANNGDYNAYIAVDELFKAFDLPIFWLQGNHDFSEVMLQVSTKINIKADKSFIIGTTKFILLQTIMRDEDNLSVNKGRGYLFDYEMSFLERELEENNFDHCVIAMHHPPILSNSWTDRRILDNRIEFVDLIEQYPKVRLVLYGHQHIAQITEINGITYIASPPASFHYDPNGENFSLLDNKQGFGIIQMSSDGQIGYESYYT